MQVLLLIADSRLFREIVEKTVPIVRWGRKATGLQFSTCSCFLSEIPTQKDSRAAECDIVKVTYGEAWLFFGAMYKSVF